MTDAIIDAPTWKRSARGHLWQRIGDTDAEITVTVFRKAGSWNVYYAGSGGRKLCLNAIARSEVGACERAMELLLQVWAEWY